MLTELDFIDFIEKETKRANSFQIKFEMGQIILIIVNIKYNLLAWN